MLTDYSDSMQNNRPILPRVRAHVAEIHDVALVITAAGAAAATLLFTLLSGRTQDDAVFQWMSAIGEIMAAV